MPRGIPISERMQQRIRSRIFKIASQLFLQKGYHETSMRDVAQAAGMGKSSLYDYFPSKAEILLYFIEQEMDATHLDAVRIANMDISAVEKLQRILQSLCSYLEENIEMAVFIARESSRLGENEARRIAKKQCSYRKILEGVVQQGIERGTFRSVDPVIAASALHSVMTAPFRDWVPHDDPINAIPNANELINLFLLGIQKR